MMSKLLNVPSQPSVAVIDTTLGELAGFREWYNNHVDGSSEFS